MDKKLKYERKWKYGQKWKCGQNENMNKAGKLKKNIETKLDKVEQNRQKLDKIKNVDKIGR